ncbi:hypothetical protein QXB71_002715 [Vibrio cholerae]|nr:hypothetical protein [Vibrio cholerae]EJL6710142.1 hypothetical protein [Vibrio cholerae]ELO1827478.1 hypothetical protein [Vibrio cholerae]
MNEDVLLKDLLMPSGKKVVSAQPFDFGQMYRLFVEVNESGFDAVAVEFVESTSVDDFWNSSELIVSEVFRLQAFFDGVRHLTFSKYVCSPDMSTLSDIFKKIHDLELIHCHSKSI